jgi:hypothetical protein
VASKKKNTGIQYERIAQVIFDHIHNSPGEARTVEVVHNTVLQGKTLKHQIDVYWKFEVGGIVYQAVVQTKDWRSTVKQGHLITFKGVLDDLLGQPRGIYVTSKGYQKGALTYANANGIDLYVLQPRVPPKLQIQVRGFARLTVKEVPVSADAPIGWVTEAVTFDPSITNMELRLADPIVDDGNPGEPSRKATVPTSLKFTLEEITLYNEAGEGSGTLGEALIPFVDIARTVPSLSASITHRFTPNTFIVLPELGGRRRIQAIKGEVSFTRRSIEQFPLDMQDIVTFILERVGTDERKAYRIQINDKPEQR